MPHLRPLPKPLALALVAALSLTGCARLAASPINPLNWFGPRPAVVAASPQGGIRPLLPAGRAAAIDPRNLIGAVTALTLEATADGAILRATGLAPTQGWYNAELVQTGLADGVLSFDFRAAAPAGQQPVGDQATRTITVATMLSPAELSGVSAIRVLGATDAQTLRR